MSRSQTELLVRQQAVLTSLVGRLNHNTFSCAEQYNNGGVCNYRATTTGLSASIEGGTAAHQVRVCATDSNQNIYNSSYGALNLPSPSVCVVFDFRTPTPSVVMTTNLLPRAAYDYNAFTYIPEYNQNSLIADLNRYSGCQLEGTSDRRRRSSDSGSSRTTVTDYPVIDDTAGSAAE